MTTLYWEEGSLLFSAAPSKQQATPAGQGGE